MAFVVEVTPRAESDIRDAYSYIREFAPEAAERWARGIRAAIASLEEMPTRCARAPEAERFGLDLRQLLYGRRTGAFRIVFRVVEDRPARTVVVLAVRRGSRDALSAGDLGDLS